MIKKSLLLMYVVLFNNLLFSQSPQKLNYQAVVRTSTGASVANGTVVNFRFTIHDQSISGTPVFTELVTDTANQFGLVNVVIGNGAHLDSVNWRSGNKYLQVEADVTNTGNYVNMGTTQLLSVPYALYALNSPAGPTGANGIAGATGLDGATGSAGVTGATGPSGQGGMTGITGASGIDGLTGVTGPTGSTGTGGMTGASGADGATGGTGATGASGIDGLSGSTGATGPSGVDGSSGTTGATGPSGVDGATGVTGATGPSGVDGSTGVTGATGPSGLDGTSGTTGATGPSGIDGLPGGPTGATGPSGADGILAPAGSIMAFAGTAAPAGWLACDGSAVSRTTYAALFTALGTAWGYGDNATTFNIPDLRGRFLRGNDDGTGRDPDAASRTASNTGGVAGNNVGTLKDEQVQAHNHTIHDPGHNHQSVNNDVVRNTNGYGTGIGTSGLGPNTILMTTNTTGITINNSTGTETRPINASVYFIIKY